MEETKLKEFNEKLTELLKEFNVSLGISQQITINPVKQEEVKIEEAV